MQTHEMPLEQCQVACEGASELPGVAGNGNLPECSETSIEAEIERAFLELTQEPRLGPHSVKVESPDSLQLDVPNWAGQSAPTDLFDLPQLSHTSITTVEEEPPQKAPHATDSANWDTVGALKREMASHSRLVGTYTTMKSAYLKLCSEFNYLLGKFNENERVKIDLIHENNQLREMLVDVIKEREIDRMLLKAQMALVS